MNNLRFSRYGGILFRPLQAQPNLTTFCEERPSASKGSINKPFYSDQSCACWANRDPRMLATLAVKFFSIVRAQDTLALVNGATADEVLPSFLQFRSGRA